MISPARPAIGLALPVLLTGAVLTGFAPILVRLSVADGVGPESAAFWRFALSLPVLALWAALEPKRSHQGRPDLRFILLAGLFFAGDLATWHAGIVRTGVANATLLPNLTPILVGAAAWLIFRERPSRGFIAGAAVALSGVALLSGAGFAAVEESARGERLLGDALSALTAVWYAAYMLAVKAARRTASTGVMMFLATLVGAAVLLGVSLAAGEAVLPPTARAWIWLLLLGVMVHAGGQGAIAFALGRLPAGFSALMILVQPLIAAIGAWILFDEALGALQLAGGALVIAGIWAASRTRPKTPIEAASPGRA